MRITKQRRAFINAVKDDFVKHGITPKLLAKFYEQRFNTFRDMGNDIIPLVEIAVDEFVKAKKWELEFGVELGLMKINK